MSQPHTREPRLGSLRTIDAWERSEGAPAPLGCTWLAAEQSYNFALYSRYATGVTLLIYDDADQVTPVYEYRFDPRFNKTQRVWHCWVAAARAPAARYYAYRIEGPVIPDWGQRYDLDKVLLDPYAPAVFFPPAFDREAARRPGPNAGQAPLGVLPRPAPPFDWGDDRRPRHTHDLIVYELHVKGFTARANSGVAAEQRGTFAGLIEKIPYLRELGVTAVELLPVHQFDPQEGNYWGYMTLSFFALHHAYASGEAQQEFKALVRALHAADIEVWLDVVYNHTCEGDATGPTYSYRGIDNRSYYLLDSEGGRYINDSGTGNTLRCGGPAVRTLVLNSLRYWIEEMHIDGFRFDLASILTRHSDGTIDPNDPALIGEISYLARLYDVRMIAEAWDIGSYQLGRGFPGITWRQWNGEFRDDVRAFVKGEGGQVGNLMHSLYGSDRLFPDSLRDAYRPYQSVNFITCHDGFCLYDLVAYNHKHNAANGHGNTDGTDHNLSWNCGVEGDVDVPPEVMRLRGQQARNLMTLLLLANGTPMLLAGDEFLNTQRGNNNPYNQDNEITWLDWDRLDQHRDMHRFVRLLIAFRKAHPTLQRSHFWRDDVAWHGVDGPVDFGRESRAVAFHLRGAALGDVDLYVMINGHWEALDFRLPDQQPSPWRRVVDTGRVSPDDISEAGHEPVVAASRYQVVARSIVVLMGRETGG
jgi:glycogen operon protein